MHVYVKDDLRMEFIVYSNEMMQERKLTSFEFYNNNNNNNAKFIKRYNAVRRLQRR